MGEIEGDITQMIVHIYAITQDLALTYFWYGESGKLICHPIPKPSYVNLTTVLQPSFYCPVPSATQVPGDFQLLPGISSLSVSHETDLRNHI